MSLNETPPAAPATASARDPLALHRAYDRLFRTPDGRAVLADLEHRGMHRATTFSPDAARAAFNEGRRSIVLHVHHMMRPENFRAYLEDA